MDVGARRNNEHNSTPTDSGHVPEQPCRGGATQPACKARTFERSKDLAWSGNGYAQNAGAYGNGSTWIGAGAGSCVKMDLGRIALIDGIRFGRDRTGGFDDRDPGGFSVYVAITDLYANGNEANDATEYVKVYDSAFQGFSGTIAGPDTIEVRFSLVAARYVTVVFNNNGAAIGGPALRPGAPVSP